MYKVVFLYSTRTPVYFDSLAKAIKYVEQLKQDNIPCTIKRS